MMTFGGFGKMGRQGIGKICKLHLMILWFQILHEIFTYPIRPQILQVPDEEVFFFLTPILMGLPIAEAFENINH